MLFNRHNWQVINKYFETASCYFRKNPVSVIVLVGLIAATISCYPVVFYGKSFVSPAGVVQLYSSPPYMPGFDINVIAENYRGSDIFATLRSIVPNTIVQSNALLDYNEFPYWTRYGAGGVPLYAQGQSMIGDILHWIPLMLRGSAVGWDIKFILAKAIFAIGVGLLVFRFTCNRVASILISISACFLGFYAFRFNHPAFFVLTYSPWIVLQWDKLGKTITIPRTKLKNILLDILILGIVTWLQLNAGAPKEGYITACFMHALGVACFYARLRSVFAWHKSLIVAAGYGFALALFVSPHWLIFIDALNKSYTVYDSGGVVTYPLWSIVGFFDNYYYQALHGNLSAPSTNLFVLFCLPCSFLYLLKKKKLQVCGAWALFIMATIVANGLIPESIILSTPFIKSIIHVGNTFSIPMLILSLVLSGYGISYLCDEFNKPKAIGFVAPIALFALLGFVFFLFIQDEKAFLFFIASLVVIVITSSILYKCSVVGIFKRYQIVILICCFFFFHLHLGMHLMTGFDKVDYWVMNPTKRADFSQASESMEFINNRINDTNVPSRVVGVDYFLFPGTNSMFEIEGPIHAEPLKSKHYEELMNIMYTEAQWGWVRLLPSERVAEFSAVLDFLNIGYIITSSHTDRLESYQLIHSSDLNVWERDTVWPRAYYVNSIVEIAEPPEILEVLSKYPNRPLAIVEDGIAPDWIKKSITAEYLVIPAEQYFLTNNSTSFSLVAPGPGLIVLNETYYPKDFIAMVNDKAVDYIRVNHAFKGIWVEEAGGYEVSFTYRPEKLQQSLLLFFSGFIMMFLISFVAFRFSYHVEKII